ncbi:hypothetical protein BRADI_4g03089v3 [Brachypodium distachyon]|uniref:Uncharacterized protein n=1 Tax=Brachypodium distachyon TaxID=15368 RepID=A0A0Q3GYU8_BRADI|nr:hypothetical protein BRADI_4g03089v3 [Brachypodium distachyon]
MLLTPVNMRLIRAPCLRRLKFVQIQVKVKYLLNSGGFRSAKLFCDMKCGYMAHMKR